jgi:hypothetical protein
MEGNEWLIRILQNVKYYVKTQCCAHEEDKYAI